MEGSSFQLSISNKVHDCTSQASDDSDEHMEDTDGRREESDDLDEDMEDPDGSREESGDTNGTKEEAFYDPTVLFTGKPYRDLTLGDLQGVEFKTVEEAEKFYSYYSLVMGFSTRKYKIDWNRSGTIVRRRELVCSKQGKRKEPGKERECME